AVEQLTRQGAGGRAADDTAPDDDCVEHGGHGELQRSGGLGHGSPRVEPGQGLVRSDRGLVHGGPPPVADPGAPTRRPPPPAPPPRRGEPAPRPRGQWRWATGTPPPALEAGQPEPAKAWPSGSDLRRRADTRGGHRDPCSPRAPATPPARRSRRSRPARGGRA